MKIGKRVYFNGKDGLYHLKWNVLWDHMCLSMQEELLDTPNVSIWEKVDDDLTFAFNEFNLTWN